MTWSVVSSSASASYVNITLCRNISVLTYLTSSGVTYPLPSVNARDFEAFKIFMVALGEAPVSYTHLRAHETS